MSNRDTDDALTRLVQQYVGEGRPLTTRAFAERAVDPQTGQRISKSTAGNIVNGHQIKLTPAVVRAIAAGLGRPFAEVRDAAIRQYVGVVMDDLGDGVAVVHRPGVAASEVDVRGVLGDWGQNENQNNSSSRN